MLEKNSTKFFGLGGYQEIGKSTTVITHGKDIFICDAGIKFGNSSITGIKGIIPDYEYLIQNKENIVGLFLTHGHEDHMGGIVYLAENVNLKKIVAPAVGIAYLKAKFAERKVKLNIEWVEIDVDLVLNFGETKVDFWSAQHSIPDAFGIRFSTPNGSLMFTGDWRFDYSPIGSEADFGSLEKFGKEKLTVLFSDSTNAMRPNHSPSEKDIMDDLIKYMKSATKKIIITAFASNMSRVAKIIETAAEMGKKVVCLGRSMVNSVKIARDQGILKTDQSVIIDKKNISKFDDNELLILTTGSQGEQLAALSKMAHGKHPQVQIKHKDLIIFSSSPIPGNRIKIELLVNQLYKFGAIIKENGIDGYLHTSGHAYHDEQLKLISICKPKYFAPYHGEYRMSVVHGQTAIEAGVDPKNIVIVAHGEVYELKNDELLKTREVVEFGPIYIDGENPSKSNTKIIQEREILGENGFVHVIVLINKKRAEIAARVKIITRGTFYVKNSIDIINQSKKLVHGAILYKIKNSNDWTENQIKNLIQDRLKIYFYKTKRRYPAISSSIQIVDNLKVLKSKEK